MTVKKYLQGSDHDLVDKKDILQSGDWLLKFDPSSPDDTSGFSLYTPKDFDPDAGGGPLGGMILAAVYFLVEHGDREFPKELVARANELSKQMHEERKENNTSSIPARTLN